MRSLRAVFADAARHQAPYGFATRVMREPRRWRGKKSPWFVPFSGQIRGGGCPACVITVGILAGRAMTNSSSAATATNIASSFSLDLFDATPPGSLAARILP